MNVTYLVSDLGGGTGQHLLSMLARPEAGWDSRIISEEPNTSRLMEPVPIQQLPRLPRYSRFPLSQVWRWRQISRLVTNEPPDILHSFFFWSILYGRLLKARGLVDRLVENREDTGFSWGPLEYLLLRLTRAQPDRVICVSDAVRRVVLTREGLPADKTVVICNGLSPPYGFGNADMELRAELNIPDYSPVVGMVANFDRPVKGVSYFVEALGFVARRVPDVRFLLVGMGDPRDAVARSRELGVADNLIVTGFRSDVEAIYNLLDVSVLTSLSEGLSITILESMRAGCPVVATDVGGNPELVVPGETGFLVPPRDAAATAGRIMELLSDAGLRERMGRRAATIVEARFSLDRVAESYGEVYDNVASVT